MFLKTMQHKDTNEQNTLLLAHHTVMGYALAPTECYHTFTEDYFE